ncbi:Hypothetical predicted protein [Pelobates cultripes]|uniref:Uncharacterized protein n=1 Tax=Pelobates cultripes TaxID=61616 RepID=A0AAD1S2P7_PELCU|nr:Hypothetical predicted protein [Pelobates cultripes]
MTTVRRCVWNQIPARIRRSTLEWPNSEGGTGLPSIITYYQAMHLHRLVDWHANPSTKQWVNMELQQAQGKIPILLWIGEATQGDMYTGNPMIDATLRVWCRV